MKSEIVERILKLMPECPYQGATRCKENDPPTIRLCEYTWRVACTASANKLAENAVVVGGEVMESTREFIWSKPRGPHLLTTSHTALLIDVRPLKPVDPLVKKLRDEAKKFEGWDTNISTQRLLREAADKLEGKS